MSDGDAQATARERAPGVYAQALEAAADDPERQELSNMVYGLPDVCELLVDGEDEDWRETTITVGFKDTPGSATAHVASIMRTAGWKFDGATFAHNRLHFVEAEES